MDQPTTTTTTPSELPTFDKPRPKSSLKERIALASTVPELDSLLAEGANYLAAAPKTIRMWEKAATKRKEELLSK